MAENKILVQIINKLLQVEGNRTVAHDVICCNLRGVMEIFRYIPPPKTNAFLDCIYHSQAPCCRAPIPYQFTSPGIQGRMGSLP